MSTYSKSTAVSVIASLVFVITMLLSVSSHAVTVGFYRITNNGDFDAAAQLSVDITDNGDGALLDFSVSAGPNPGANITEIYFDDNEQSPLFAPPPVIISQINANFTPGIASPGNLPGGNTIAPPFVATTLLVADAQGASANGLTIGDTLIMKLVYSSGYGFADVLSGLNDGSFRIGLHVRSLIGGQGLNEESDGFVNIPPIPLPAALPLYGTGLAVMGFLGWRRKRRAQMV